MFGLNSFSLIGQTKVKFVSLTGSNTTISSTTNFNLLEFCYWSLKFRTCPPSNPYYCSTDGLCYDICPTGTYVNTTSKLCLACSFTCETCSSSSLCLTCSSSNFRYLNGTSCKPIVGYYENGTAIAAACSVPLGSPCLNCTNNVTCVSCANGYYLSAGQCSICSLNCLACTGSLACTSCSSSYILVSGQCIISNSTNNTVNSTNTTNSTTTNTTTNATNNTTTNTTTNVTNSTTNTTINTTNLTTTNTTNTANTTNTTNQTNITNATNQTCSDINCISCSFSLGT